MPRQRSGERVRGPWKYQRGTRIRWRIRYTPAEESAPIDRYFKTEKEARQFIDVLNAELLSTEERSIGGALSGYFEYLTKKGNKPSSLARTRWSLSKFLSFNDENAIETIRQHTLEQRYQELTASLSVDSHRNALAELKSFFRWTVERRILSKNPAESIKGLGKRRRGKPQLRASESRRWLDKAIELANEGNDGAVAAMMSLLLGLRATEITLRVVRDVDAFHAAADTLWIPETKTESGRRQLQIPKVLRPYLLTRTRGRPSTDWLFPARGGKPHDRGWPNKQVQRICRLAMVPAVSAHGMRGAHATLALARGSTGQVVAASLGHADESTTRTSYAKPRADEQVQRRRFYDVLGSNESPDASSDSAEEPDSDPSDDEE